LVSAPMHALSKVAHKIFSSLRPYKLNIPEASRDRRLGTAIEVAPAIIQGPSTEIPDRPREGRGLDLSFLHFGSESPTKGA
ncbi:Protein transport protein Sec23A, partial [Datura stramonium]|nr:Protein transport protein Sec23A [Datura stramonium]